MHAEDSWKLMVVCPGEKTTEMEPGTKQKGKVSKDFAQGWRNGLVWEMFAVQDEGMSLIPRTHALKTNKKTAGYGGIYNNAGVGEMETGESLGLTGQPLYPSQWNLTSHWKVTLKNTRCSVL